MSSLERVTERLRQAASRPFDVTPVREAANGAARQVRLFRGERLRVVNAQDGSRVVGTLSAVHRNQLASQLEQRSAQAREDLRKDGLSRLKP